MPSILELKSLYEEALLRELVERTKVCAITWEFMGSTQFHANETDTTSEEDPITWDFYLTKTQVGSLSFKYSLDVKRNQTTYINVTEGPMPATKKDSVIKDLYEIVEIYVLEVHKKLKDAIRFVQELKGCADE